MLFADGPVNLDWTAIAIAAMTLVLGGLGWLGRRLSGRIERHMDEVAKFMVASGKSDVAFELRLDHHEQRFTTLEQRVNESRRIGEIHKMVGDMHDKGCGPAIALEGR